jgi:hypothetical protein
VATVLGEDAANRGTTVGSVLVPVAREALSLLRRRFMMRGLT